MFRVAVIQNETEMLISGYANIVSRLKNLARFSDYSFEVFTVVNIHKLFETGDFALCEFDSLIITTNATSDSSVLNILRYNVRAIEEFISLGKGVFVGSQKKLSSLRRMLSDSSTDSVDKSGKTLFLPPLYEFRTIERPKAEKDSGQGKISLASNSEIQSTRLLSFPYLVTPETTQKICENNGFRRHVYRSHIVPDRPGAYINLLVDKTTDPEDQRTLLVTNAVPQRGERIVLSTIVVDWEFHQDLLMNIIVYITEGLPKLAFVRKSGQKHGDFDFLLTGARLSKVSHAVYENTSEINHYMYTIHDNYVFSPDWDEKCIEEFIGTVNIQESQKSRYNRSHIKVNFFRRLSNTLLLNQYSNFSSIDLIVRNSTVWLSSKFEGKEWGGSFWITYDIVRMMVDLDVDVSNYIPSLFRNIETHYLDGSYDAVIGATCGLLDLTVLLINNSPSALSKTNFGSSQVREMLHWLMSSRNSDSEYDLQTIALTIAKVYNYLDQEMMLDQYHQEILDLKKIAEDSLNNILQSPKDCSEMDICRFISLAIFLKRKDTSCEILLIMLKDLQAVNGKWTNIVRTAHVLTFLMKNANDLKALGVNLDKIGISDLIYQGILFLRSEYRPSLGNWDNDLQATAKSTYAVGLYNELYQYSTQDFFHALDRDEEVMQYSDSLKNLGQSMDLIRANSNDLISQYENLLKDQNRFKELISDGELFEIKILRENSRLRTFTVVFGSLLVALLLSLMINHSSILIKLLTEIGSLINIVVAFSLGLILTNFSQQKLVKGEVVKTLKNQRTRQLNKKNRDLFSLLRAR
jgi:hypothetical protein